MVDRLSLKFEQSFQDINCFVTNVRLYGTYDGGRGRAAHALSRDARFVPPLTKFIEVHPRTCQDPRPAEQQARDSLQAFIAVCHNLGMPHRIS